MGEKIGVEQGFNREQIGFLKKSLQVATKNVTDIGALMLPFDRPEQGLDMIQEAMNHFELTPGEDFYIALNLAGHEIFDYVSPSK